MRLELMVAIAALGCAPVHAQRPFPDIPSIGMISVNADRHGRKSFCDELIRLSASAEALLVVPEDGEIRCFGPLHNRMELRVKTEPNDPQATVCAFAQQSTPLVFREMRPLALRRDAASSPPLELQLTLQRLGATTLGRVLEAFGFESLALWSVRAEQTLGQVGIHELLLACPDAA